MPDSFETKPIPDRTPNVAAPNVVSNVNNIRQEEPPKTGLGQRILEFYRANKIYVWAIVLGGALISVLAYFAFRGGEPQAPTEANVVITTEAPQVVASGGEVVYKIKVENKDSQKLTGLQLDLTYPEGTSYLRSTPKALNSSGTSFTVPDLVSGQNVVVSVVAKVTGNINDTKELRALLSYHINGFSLEFVKEHTYAVRLIASNIELAVEGPKTTSSAQLVQYTVRYKNNSQEQIRSGRVQLTFPQGFSVALTQPNPDLNNNIWNVNQLAAGGEGTVTVHGTYNASPGEGKTIAADFLILGATGEYYTQASASATTELASTPLLVTQEIDRHSSGIVNPGDILQFTVRYQNNNTVVARGVNIVVTLDGKALDLATVRSEGGIVNNNTITWNASTAGQLESVNPGESGQVSFLVEVHDPATRDSSKDLEITSAAKIKSDEFPDFFPGTPIALKVATQTSISSALRFDTGSLPPQVGRMTTYTVRLSIRNATNALNDVVVSGFVPLGANGFDTGSVTPSEAAKVQYDSSTGKFTWNVGVVPAHTGSFQPTKQLEFKVRLQPAASQAGSSPVLVRDITLSGTDSFTNQNIAAGTDNIETSDLEGQDGYSKGQVMP